jgi:hypothetical protein
MIGSKNLLATELGVPHISLVFCEMWDTTALDLRILEPISALNYESPPATRRASATAFWARRSRASGL